MFIPPIEDADIDRLLEKLNQNVPENDRLVLDVVRRATIVGYEDVQACPGSGKTTLVALKLLVLARKWPERNSGICVLTHTNVAKDEIVSRLQGDPHGEKLLGYPHFVGTIQEFVHAFLALPYCRSAGLEPHYIDDDKLTLRMDSRLTYGARSYLQKKNASVENLRIKYLASKLDLQVPGFEAKSSSDTYKELVRIRTDLAKEGYFSYSEMYAFAFALIGENHDAVASIRMRFPVALLDEAQDTQGEQNTLLDKLFGGGHARLQRFGDPDQAIFDGFGDGEGNQAYNEAILVPIADSNRFSAQIAGFLPGLSARKLAVTGLRPISEGTVPCALILFDNATVANVLNAFSAHIAQMPVELRQVVKAVGGVGQNAVPSAKSLNLKNYWPDYARPKAPHARVTASMIEAVVECCDLQSGPLHKAHGLFLRGVVEMLSIAGKGILRRTGGETKVTVGNLRKYLRQHGDEGAFRLLAAELHLGVKPNPASWASIVARLRACCGIDPAEASVNAYLAYQEVDAPQFDEAAALRYVAENGTVIDVATIHSVKGETHDVTLVVETKHSTLFDMEEMIPFLLDHQKARPLFDEARPRTHASLKAGFLKKLYVGCSRARHVVCLAMHKDRLTQAQQLALQQDGWKIIQAT